MNWIIDSSYMNLYGVFSDYVGRGNYICSAVSEVALVNAVEEL